LVNEQPWQGLELKTRLERAEGWKSEPASDVIFKLTGTEWRTRLDFCENETAMYHVAPKKQQAARCKGDVTMRWDSTLVCAHMIQFYDIRNNRLLLSPAYH